MLESLVQFSCTDSLFLRRDGVFIIFLSRIQESLQCNSNNDKLKDDKGQKIFLLLTVCHSMLPILFGLGWTIGRLLFKISIPIRQYETGKCSLSETTFTNSFLEDMNEKKKLQREEEKTESTKKIVELFYFISYYYPFICSIVLLKVLCCSLVHHFVPLHLLAVSAVLLILLLITINNYECVY